MAGYLRSPQQLKQASEITTLELVQISSPEHWVKGHSSPVFLTVSRARAILLLPWIRLLFIHKTRRSKYQPRAWSSLFLNSIAMLLMSRFSWAANQPDFIEQFTFPSRFFKLKNYRKKHWHLYIPTLCSSAVFFSSAVCELWYFALTCLTANLTSVVLFNQSNHLNHSNKDCEWLILACFMRVQMHADATSVCSENKVCFENHGECVGKWKDSLS